MLSCVDTVIDLRYPNITLSRSSFVPVSFNFRIPITYSSCSSSSCCILWNATFSMKQDFFFSIHFPHH